MPKARPSAACGARRRSTRCMSIFSPCPNPCVARMWEPRSCDAPKILPGNVAASARGWIHSRSRRAGSTKSLATPCLVRFPTIRSAARATSSASASSSAQDFHQQDPGAVHAANEREDNAGNEPIEATARAELQRYSHHGERQRRKLHDQCTHEDPRLVIAPVPIGRGVAQLNKLNACGNEPRHETDG